MAHFEIADAAAVLREKKSASGIIIRPRSIYELEEPNTLFMSCPHPRQPHGPFNRNANERSSMKNPERFNAFAAARIRAGPCVL
jgi:hypothetical protein